MDIKIEIPDNKNKPMEKCITGECEKQIKKAINALLNANYIKAYDSTNGIEYKINEDQKKVCNNLKSTYSLKYKKIVKLVLAKIKSKSREQIINELNLFITNSVIKERGETL